MDRDTTVARIRVQDAESAIKHEAEDVWNADLVWSTTRKPQKTLEEMLNAIRDSLRAVESSDDEEDREYESDDEQGAEYAKLIEDAEPGWKIDTICKMAQQHMESFRQNLMRHCKLIQPGEGDVAECFCERDMKCWTAQMTIPAVIIPQTDPTASTPSPTR